MKNNKESTGGELTDYPNDKYKKFFENFAEIDTLDVAAWKPVHVLAYFCKKYKETYGVGYKFKFNSPLPTKCFEVFQIKKLAMNLTANPTLLRDYIDWIYQTKVIAAKRRLTSISFMVHDGLVQEYKTNVLLAGKQNLTVDRSTPLPEKFKTVFKEAGTSINTYGELAFVSQMNPLSSELTAAMTRIQEIGFDKEVLSRIV